MNKKYQQLIKEAVASLGTVHKLQPPHLRFGAAVLTKKGNIYSAANYWSYTATLTLHAEQAALAHAAAHGERDIVAVACISTEEGRQFCHPCGICKQLIWESAKDSGIDIEVVMANGKGKVVVKKISELVPFPWP